MILKNKVHAHAHTHTHTETHPGVSYILDRYTKIEKKNQLHLHSKQRNDGYDVMKS